MLRKTLGVVFVLVVLLALGVIVVAVILPTKKYALALLTRDGGLQTIERYVRRLDCEGARREVLAAYKFPSSAEAAFQCVRIDGRKDAIVAANDN